MDESAFAALCDSLRHLEGEWKNASFVDKELAQDLYVLAPVVRNVADSLRKHDGDLAQRIEGMAVQLDGLVLNCLSS